MESHKIFIDKDGFTLIETLIVCAIITMLASLVFIVDLSVYFKKSFEESSIELYTTLAKARSQSMHNVCRGPQCTEGKSHGVYITRGAYILYEGESFNLRDPSMDELFVFNDAAYSANSVDVNFTQLSGNINVPVIFTIYSDFGSTQTFQILHEGVIDW